MRLTIPLSGNATRLPDVLETYGDTARLLDDVDPSADPLGRAELYRRLVDDVHAGRNPEWALVVLLHGQRHALASIQRATRARDIGADAHAALILACFYEVVRGMGPDTRVGPALFLTVRTRVLREMKKTRSERQRLDLVGDTLKQHQEACDADAVPRPDDVVEQRQFEAALPDKAAIAALARRAKVHARDVELLRKVHVDGLSYREVARSSVRRRGASRTRELEERRLRRRGHRACKRFVEYLDAHPDDPVAAVRELLRGRGCRRSPPAGDRHGD